MPDLRQGRDGEWTSNPFRLPTFNFTLFGLAAIVGTSVGIVLLVVFWFVSHSPWTPQTTYDADRRLDANTHEMEQRLYASDQRTQGAINQSILQQLQQLNASKETQADTLSDVQSDLNGVEQWAMGMQRNPYIPVPHNSPRMGERNNR
jgi:hypothetical protein